jgi:hypothetical protein
VKITVNACNAFNYCRRFYVYLLLVIVLTGCGGGATGNSQLKIGHISPEALTAGYDSVLTIEGDGFTKGSIAYLNDKPETTTYQGAYRLGVKIPAVDILVMGNYELTVDNPDGEKSNAITVNVGPNAPTITSFTPSSVAAGSPGFQLDLHGNFIPQSTVLFNGQSRPTHYVSNYELTANITTSDVGTAQTGIVSVQNSASAGGNTSSPVYLEIGYSLKYMSQFVNHLVWDAVNQVLYASVPSNDYYGPTKSHGDSVIAIDPYTLEVISSVQLEGNPDALALSGDSKYLYVGIDGDSSVSPYIQRLTLPGLGKDISWSAGSALTTSNTPIDIEVSPDDPETTAVLYGNRTPNYLDGSKIVIYDNSVARSTTVAPSANDFYSVQWGIDNSTLYAAHLDSSTPYDDLDIFTVTSGGLNFSNSYQTSQYSSQNGRIRFDRNNDLIYSDVGSVIDVTGNTLGIYAPCNTQGVSGASTIEDVGVNKFFSANSFFYQGATLNIEVCSNNLSTYGYLGKIVVPTGTLETLGIIRYGSDGLVFFSKELDKLFFINGQFVSAIP